MAETYNLIQTLQKLRDDLKLWSSNNFRNVLSKLSSHEGSAEAHSAVFANYMAIENFASTDPENYKVDHAIYADATNQADNAAKLGGTDASAYAKIADLDFAASVHKHNIEDINGPVTSPQDSTYFIPVSIGSGSAPSWIDEGRYALATSLSNYQSKLTPGDYIDITNNIIKVKNIDTTVTKNSTNIITSGAVATALEGVTISLDENITNNSPNPVSGTTIYTYVTGQLANYYTKDEINQKIADLGEGEVTLTNSFATIAVGDTPVNLVAESSTDTLKIKAGDGIELTADANTDTLTIQTAGLMKTADYTGTGTSVVNKADNANKLGGVSADGYALKEHIHNYEYVIELDPVYISEAASNNQWVSYPFTDAQINIINNHDDVLLKANLGNVTILAYKQHIDSNIILFTSGLTHFYEEYVSQEWTSVTYEVLVNPTNKMLAVRAHEHLRKEDINATYALKTEIPTDYINTEALNSTLSNYVSTTTLSEYSTTSQMNAAIDAAKPTIDTAMSADSTNPVQNKVISQYVTNTVSGYTYSKSEVDEKIANAGSGGTIDLSGYMAKDKYDLDDNGIVDKAEQAIKLYKSVSMGNMQNYMSLELNDGRPTYRFVNNASAEPSDITSQIAFISDFNNYYTKNEISGLGYLTSAALNNYYNKSETMSSSEISTAINNAKITVDSSMNNNSSNPVQNKVIMQYIADTLSSYYNKTESDNAFATKSHKHAISDLTTPSSSPENGSRFILTTLGSSGSAKWTDDAAYVTESTLNTRLQNIESTGSEFKIKDSSSNVIAQVDKDGLTTTKVTAKELEVRGEKAVYEVGKELHELNQQMTNHAHNGFLYLTTAPTSANTSLDMKIVVLRSEPAMRYEGYLYIITS